MRLLLCLREKRTAGCLRDIDGDCMMKSNTQTSHTENIPYALKIQHELDVKIHSCTPLPIQMAPPKSGQVAHETLQQRFDEQNF